MPETSSVSESVVSSSLRLILLTLFEVRLSIDSSHLFDLCLTAVSSGSAAAVPLHLEDMMGTSLLDVVMKGDLCRVSCHGFVEYFTPSSV